MTGARAAGLQRPRDYPHDRQAVSPRGRAATHTPHGPASHAQSLAQSVAAAAAGSDAAASIEAAGGFVGRAALDWRANLPPHGRRLGVGRSALSTAAAQVQQARAAGHDGQRAFDASLRCHANESVRLHAEQVRVRKQPPPGAREASRADVSRSARPPAASTSQPRSERKHPRVPVSTTPPAAGSSESEMRPPSPDRCGWGTERSRTGWLLPSRSHSGALAPQDCSQVKVTGERSLSRILFVRFTSLLSSLSLSRL